jgi:PBP1b-binding outer membrane lipoprotein LpoB
MTMSRRIVSLGLVAILVAGCASHRVSAPANGHAPDTDDEIGSIAASEHLVWSSEINSCHIPKVVSTPTRSGSLNEPPTKSDNEHEAGAPQ